MSTKPDDTTLALWLDDELKGEELAAVETWVNDHPEQLAAREEIRRWREMVSTSVPATEEPPAPEIFNERIARAIREEEEAKIIRPPRQAMTWRSAFMPLAACAGMALAFWLGMINPATAPKDLTTSPANNPSVYPFVYTPVSGVQAEWFSSTKASATVIVLNGVDAIPDSLDFSATASTQQWNEMNSTAGAASPTNTDL